MRKKQKIIFLGGGNTGAQFAEIIDECLFDILLMNKINHQFKTLFYLKGTSLLKPSSISLTLRNVFKKKNRSQLWLAEILSFGKDNNEVSSSIDEFPFEYLIMAIGCTTNILGNDDRKAKTLTLCSTYDAIPLSNYILQKIKGIISTSEEGNEGLINFDIAVAVPTGVEQFVVFVEIKKYISPKDYQEINFSKFEIFLIEASKNKLNSLSYEAKEASKNYLEVTNVIVSTKRHFKDSDANILNPNAGETLKTKTEIWGASVPGNKIDWFSSIEIAVGHRLKVDRINEMLELSNIFVHGDIVLMKTQNYVKEHPQIANVAFN